MSSTGTWKYDLKNGAVHWSDEMFLIFGHAKEAKLPSFLDLSEYIHHSDRFQWELLINRITIDGKKGEITVRIYDSEDIKWVKTVAEGVFEGMDLICLQGSCEDVTESKRKEYQYFTIED